MFRVPKLLPWRGIASAVMITIVACAAVLGGVVTPGSTSAAYAESDNSETEITEPAGLVVAPDTPVIRSSADDFQFQVLLKNPGPLAIGAGEVVLSLDNVRAESAADLELDAERDTLEIARVPLEETLPGENQTVSASVTRNDMPLLFTRLAGVYSLRAEFVPSTPVDDAAIDEPPLRSVTPLVWNGVDSASPLPFTLVVPLVLPSSVQTLPTRDELARTAPKLSQVFEAAERHNATIAIDPRILAGIRVLGSDAPAAAVTLLESIEKSAAPIILLQFADADPAVQAALGFDELLKPIGFSRAQSKSDSAPATPKADETLANPEGELPEFDGLLDLSNAKPGAWPADGEVDSATLGLLRNAGLTSLVLDSQNVSAATSSRVEISDFEALIANQQLGEAARDSIAADSTTERAAGSARLAAGLALSAQLGEAGAVLAIDRAALADSPNPLAIFDELDSFAWAQAVSERQQAAGTASLRAGTATEDRRELLRATLVRAEQIDALAPLLRNPDYLHEYQRERVLQALSAGSASPLVDFVALDERIKQRDEQLLLGVHPVVTENTQLVGTLSHIPITLNNALPFDALVNLHATPTSAAISVSTRNFEVRVPADGTANVLVPVHSRISSGDTGLELEVQDHARERVFTTALLPLTLRTTIETVMIWVFGSAAALLLGFGIFRSIRRRRSHHKSLDAVEASESDEIAEAEDEPKAKA